MAEQVKTKTATAKKAPVKTTKTEAAPKAKAPVKAAPVKKVAKPVAPKKEAKEVVTKAPVKKEVKAPVAPKKEAKPTVAKSQKVEVVKSVANKVTFESKLPAELFASEKIYEQAIFDTILSDRASRRQGTHQVKNRAQVSGTGKKP